MKITEVKGLEVLDSRGNPTIEVEVKAGSFKGKAIAPSGASTGTREAVELRDGGKRFDGKGVLKAVEQVKKISKKLVGLNVEKQKLIDRIIIDYDGTKNKSKIGGNTSTAVSIAVFKTASAVKKKELYECFEQFNFKERREMPVPLMNIINGGVHAGNKLSIQEFKIIPAKFNSFKEALTAGVEVYHELGRELIDKKGVSSKNVGDEGGFAPNISKTREALDFIEKSIEKTGYSNEVFIGLDCASNSFYKNGAYQIDGKTLEKNNLLDYYDKLVKDYNIISIEDPFNENDFEGFSEIKSLGIQVIGDDLFTSNVERLREGIQKNSANALLLKVNQVGTLTEALETARVCKKNNYEVIVSHRSGDTEDSFIADLTFGINASQIKTGAPARGERTCKYNRLLEIESQTKAKLSKKILKFT